MDGPVDNSKSEEEKKAIVNKFLGTTRKLLIDERSIGSTITRITPRLDIIDRRLRRIFQKTISLKKLQSQSPDDERGVSQTGASTVSLLSIIPALALSALATLPRLAPSPPPEPSLTIRANQTIQFKADRIIISSPMIGFSRPIQDGSNGVHKINSAPPRAVTGQGESRYRKAPAIPAPAKPPSPFNFTGPLKGLGPLAPPSIDPTPSNPTPATPSPAEPPEAEPGADPISPPPPRRADPSGVPMPLMQSPGGTPATPPGEADTRRVLPWTSLQRPPTIPEIDQAMKGGTKFFDFDVFDGGQKAADHILQKGGEVVGYNRGMGNKDWGEPDRSYSETLQEALKLPGKYVHLDNTDRMSYPNKIKMIRELEQAGKIVIPKNDVKFWNSFLEANPEYAQKIPYAITENQVGQDEKELKRLASKIPGGIVNMEWQEGESRRRGADVEAHARRTGVTSYHMRGDERKTGYEGRGAEIYGSPPPTTPIRKSEAAPGTIDPARAMYLGDSIAHGARLATSGDGVTKVGASPKYVLDVLKDQVASPEAIAKLREQGVILSTGVSNNPIDLSRVREQIDLLKKHSIPFRVIGVGPSIEGRRPGINKQLREWAGRENFVDISPIISGDGVHPRSQKIQEQIAKTEIARSLMIRDAASQGPVAPPPAPPDPVPEDHPAPAPKLVEEAPKPTTPPKLVEEASSLGKGGKTSPKLVE